MTLVYIDDVVKELISALEGNPHKEGDFCKVSVEYRITLGEIVDLIYSFKESRNDLQVPDLANAFTKKLYSTYLSYLPEDQFSYPLKMNIDERGSFTEFLKSPTGDRYRSTSLNRASRKVSTGIIPKTRSFWW